MCTRTRPIIDSTAEQTNLIPLLYPWLVSSLISLPAGAGTTAVVRVREGVIQTFKSALSVCPPTLRVRSPCVQQTVRSCLQKFNQNINHGFAPSLLINGIHPLRPYRVQSASRPRIVLGEGAGGVVNHGLHLVSEAFWSWSHVRLFYCAARCTAHHHTCHPYLHLIAPDFSTLTSQSSRRS